MKPICLVAVLWISLAGANADSSSVSFVPDPSKSAVDIHVKATGHDFSGKLVRYQAKAEVDRQSLKPVRGTFSWKFADLDTGNESRDAKMLEWLGSAQQANGDFTFRKWSVRKDGAWIVHGTLRMHGVEKPLSFPIHVKREGNDLIVSGKALVNYTDFGLPVITFLKFFKVDPEVTVAFTVKGSFN